MTGCASRFCDSHFLAHLRSGFTSESSSESEVDFLLFVSRYLNVHLAFVGIVGGVFEENVICGYVSDLTISTIITNVTVNYTGLL